MRLLELSLSSDVECEKDELGNKWFPRVYRETFSITFYRDGKEHIVDVLKKVIALWEYKE